jgi:hypothetical protein
MSEIAILNTSQGVSVFNSPASFEQAQRMVVPLAQSTMVPELYRNNVPNCMVAMEMSHRIGKSVLEVMQNMQIVKGNTGWKSEYVISEINRSNIFKEPLEFVFSNDRKSCYAIAERKNGKVVQGTPVSMEMAKSEGWLDKNGSKWKTMPEQMLMYRAATFFCRVYCPEVLAGVQTADEITDIGYTEVVPANSSIEKFSDYIENTDFEDLEVNEPEVVSPVPPVVSDLPPVASNLPPMPSDEDF